MTEGDGLNRFNDAPDGPLVSIYGDVKWPKGWTLSEKKAWINLEQSLKGKQSDPNGKVAVLEYDLYRNGPKPNYLKFLRDRNPHVEWPDNPDVSETFEVEGKTTRHETHVTVFDVVAYILDKCGSMTTWKLQKLVYYIKLESFALGNEPLFEEPIEAWRHGPVVPKLFAWHRGKFLIHEIGPDVGNSKKLNTEQQETADRIIERYGLLTPEKLEELAHQEMPWQRARKRGGHESDERSKEKILDADMKEWSSVVLQQALRTAKQA